MTASGRKYTSCRPRPEWRVRPHRGHRCGAGECLPPARSRPLLRLGGLAAYHYRADVQCDFICYTQKQPMLSFSRSLCQEDKRFAHRRIQCLSPRWICSTTKRRSNKGLSELLCRCTYGIRAQERRKFRHHAEYWKAVPETALVFNGSYGPWPPERTMVPDRGQFRHVVVSICRGGAGNNCLTSSPKGSTSQSGKLRKLAV